MISEELLTEYHALTAGAGYVDVSDRTKIELRGPDRSTFLHNFCTNDIKRLQPGQGCEAFLCNVKGHVLAHVAVLCSETSVWLDTVPGQAEKIVAHLDRYLIREKVEIYDRTSDFNSLLVSGEASLDLFKGVLHAPFTFNDFGAQGYVVSHDITSHLCVLCNQPLGSMQLTEEAMASGSPLPCSNAALEIARVEHGFPLYGIDITDDNLPQEVARNTQAISFTKGCYLGQETVARIDALGHVNRTLCGVSWTGEVVPPIGAELSAGDKVVGRVTSACWSPKLASPLALAYIRRGQDTPGTLLVSEYGPATVVSLPV